MNIDAKKVQRVVFALADGAAVVFPVAAPFVAIVEQFILAAEAAGLVAEEMSPEQATAMLAGMAAARASAVTSYVASRGKK